MSKVSAFELYQKLQPFIVDLIANTSSSSTAATGGALVAHDLDGDYHTGTLDRTQAPWVDSDISSAISTHAADPDAHHLRLHGITSASDHSVTGSALDIVGLSATNTLGILTPSSAPGAASAILKSDTSGFLTLPKLVATTKVTTPLIDTASGDVTLSPASGTTKTIGAIATYTNIAPPADLANVFYTQSESAAGSVSIGSANWGRSGYVAFNAYAVSPRATSGTPATATNMIFDGNTAGSTRAFMSLFDGNGATYKNYISPNTYANGDAITWTELTSLNASGDFTVIGDIDSGGTITAVTSVVTPLISTATNVDLVINPAGTGAVQFPNDQKLRTSDFDSSFPIEGWQINEHPSITGKSVLTIGNIQADELAVRVFVADEVRVDRGDEYWTKSYGIVAEEFTTPGTIGGPVSVMFEDSPALAGAIFVNNDWLLFRKLEIDSGLTLFNVWGQVATYVDNGDGTQNWTFTLRSGPTGETISKGSLGIDFGASGAALIHLSVIDGSGAPYIKMRTWSGANPYSPSNYTTHLQFGDLGSIGNSYYTPAGYGIYIASNADEGQFIVADDNGLQLRNTDITLFDGATQTVNIDSAGTDVWIGDGSSDKRLYWNGTTLAIEGDIIITGGSGIGSLSDAGALAEADDLDDVPNGSTYFRTTANQVTGAGRAYTAINSSNNLVTSVIPASAITPSGAGLYLGSNYMGYYDSSVWKTYIASNGDFKMAGSSGTNYLQWDASANKLQGVGSSVEQWYADATDGKLYAGAGNVWMDAGGINLLVELVDTSPSFLNFKNSSDDTRGVIGYFDTAGPTPASTDGLIFYATTGHKFRFLNATSAEFNQTVNITGGLTTTTTITSGGALSVTGNITVTGTVDGVDIAAFKTAYDSHNHSGVYLPLSGGTLTGTLTARAITFSADNTYDIGAADKRVQDLYVVNLHTDTIVGTPDFDHSHSYVPLSGGTMTDTLVMAFDDFNMISLDRTANANVDNTFTIGVSYLTGVSDDFAFFGKSNGLQVRNDGTLYANANLIWHAGNDGSGSGLDADLLDGNHASAFALSSHTHSYLPLAGGTMTGNIAFSGSQTVDGVDISAFKTAYDSHNHNSLYYTETEVDSLLTGYVPTTRTVTGTGALGGGGALSGNLTITHADTSTQASVNNSGYNFIQDVTLDDYGHVTALASVDASTLLTGYLKADGTVTGATSQAQTFTVGMNSTGGIGIGAYAVSSNAAIRARILSSDDATFYGSLFGAHEVSGAITATNNAYGQYNQIINYRTSADVGAFLNAVTGINNLVYNGATRAAYALYGLTTLVDNLATSGTVTLASGGINQIINDSTGTITTAYGLQNTIRNDEGTIGTAYGNYSTVVNDTTGSVTNAYGSYSLVRNDQGAMTTAYGNRAVVRSAVAGGTITNGYVNYADVTSDAGTITSAYLYYGTYSITAGTVSTKRGLWLTGETENSLSGTLYVAANTDATVELGRAKIGYAAGSDTATFSHYDFNNGNSAALTQFNDGTTVLQAASTKYIDLAIGGTAVWTVNEERINPQSSMLIDVGDYNRMVRTLYAAELYVQTLVAQEVISTIGGQILVAPTTKLMADVAGESGGYGTSTLYANLISYWPLDEASGSRADSVLANNLTDNNTVTSTTGKQSNAAVFTKANSEYLSITDNAGLSAGDVDFYVSCWIYPTLNDGSVMTIVSKGSSSQKAWAVNINWADGKIYLDAYTPAGALTYIGTTGTITTNTWYFVEAWHDATANTITIALNGTSASTAFPGGGVRDDNGSFMIGASESGAVIRYYQGRIDELGFWKNYIPNSTERSWLRNSTTGRTHDEIYDYEHVDGATTIDVEHNELASGDYVVLKTAPGGVAQFEVMKINSAYTDLGVGNGYRYTVIRGVDGSYVNNWYTGDAIASLGGAVGEGYIDLAAVSTVHNHIGPTMAIYSRTATANWDDMDPTVAVGNLRSFVDYASDKFGIALGNDLTLTPTSGFKGLTADATDGIRLFNVDLSAYNSTVQTVDLSTTGNLKLGTNVSAAATTSFDFTASNGETRIGFLGTNKPNLFFGSGNLQLRSGTNGTVPVITLASDGSSYFAGPMSIGASGGIYQGSSGTFASPGTGLKIWSDSGVGRLATYNGGTAQVYFDTNGRLNAGAGNVWLNANGLGIQQTVDGSNQIQFYEGATAKGRITGINNQIAVAAGVDNTYSSVVIKASSASPAKTASFVADVTSGSSFATISADAIALNGSMVSDIDMNGYDITDIGTLGSAWQNLTLNTGWVTYSASFESAQYKKVGDLIILRGMVARTSGTETIIGTLPVGYRIADEDIQGIATFTGYGAVQINPNGTLQYISGSVTWLSLGGIIFSTI